MNKKHEHKQFVTNLRNQLTLAHRMIEELKNANHAMRLHIQDLQDEVDANYQCINELSAITKEFDALVMDDVAIQGLIHIYRQNKPKGVFL